MHGDGQIQPRCLAHPVEEREVVGARKFRQSRVAQERLETHYAARSQFFHFADITGHKAAPQCEISDGGGCQGGALAVELARIDSAGRRVERHVEKKRPTSGGERTAAGCGSFPIRASRFVEMNMRID